MNFGQPGADRALRGVPRASGLPPRLDRSQADSSSSANCGFAGAIEAARPFRHDAFEAQLARIGEHHRAIGRERFAEQDSIDVGDEPH